MTDDVVPIAALAEVRPDVVLRPEDLTIVTFRPAVPGADYLMRITHQPTRLTAEAIGPSRVACGEAAMLELEEKVKACGQVIHDAAGRCEPYYHRRRLGDGDQCWCGEIQA